MDAKGQDMFPLLWDTVGCLTRLDIIILGVTCDGAKPNRRMIQLHQQAGKSNPTVHKAIIFFQLSRVIVCFSLTHLITIRNCFSNPNGLLWVCVNSVILL